MDHLPPLKTLVINGPISHPIDHLPSSLKNLKIKVLKQFCLPLDNLPSGLTHLHLVLHSFKSSIDHLPSSLLMLYLNFRSCDIRSIDYLPAAITQLHIEIRTKNNLLLGNLPPNLSKCWLSGIIMRDPISFPQSITHLHLVQTLNNKCPPNLTHFIGKGVYSSLPSSLIYLDLQECPKDDYLPHSLQTLIWRTDKPIKTFPTTLQCLHIGKYNHSLNNLPHGLKSIRLLRGFKQPLNNLPSSLTELQSNDTCFQPRDLPPNILFCHFFKINIMLCNIDEDRYYQIKGRN